MLIMVIVIMRRLGLRLRCWWAKALAHAQAQVSIYDMK